MAKTQQDVQDDSEQGSEILFGAGQSAWLAVVTVVAFIALVLAVVAIVVAGSSGSEGGGAAPAPSGPTTSPEIGAKEFAFTPSDVTVPAGQEVSAVVTNNGAVEHNWTILSEPITSEADFNQDLVLFATENVPAGEQGEVAFTLDAGEYQVICTVPGHFAAGMKGTVTVQ